MTNHNKNEQEQEQDNPKNQKRIDWKQIIKSGAVVGGSAEGLATFCRLPIILAAIDCECPERGFALGWGLPFIVGGAIGSITNFLSQSRKIKS